MSDTTGPVLTDLTFTTGLDLRNGDRPQTYTAVVQDDASGVDRVVIRFDHAYTDNIGFFHLVLLNGAQEGGTWSAARTISQYNTPGIYSITSVTVTDKVGNSRSYTPDQLATLGAPTSMEFTSDTYNPTAGDDVLTGTDRVDALNGREGNDLISGLDGNDSLYGGAGDDTITGGTGSDDLHGGDGDDLLYTEGGFVIFASLERIDGGAGTDTLITSGTLTLNAGASIEHLAAAPGALHLSLTGDSGNTVITATSGSDTLAGGGGADTLIGGAGNDTYVIKDAVAVINDLSGLDTVTTSVSFTLSEGLENLTASFFDSHALTLRGNSANNVINGGQGNDTLWGGLGADTLDGGFGKNVFILDTKITKTKNTNIDKIVNFWPSQDRIWLENSIYTKLGKNGSITKPAKLPMNAFWTGSKAHDSDDRIIYNKKNGKLYYDPDGSGPVKQIQVLMFDKKPYLSSKDFLVI